MKKCFLVTLLAVVLAVANDGSGVTATHTVEIITGFGPQLR